MLAQLVERNNGIVEVIGSIPLHSICCKAALHYFFFTKGTSDIMKIFIFLLTCSFSMATSSNLDITVLSERIDNSSSRIYKDIKLSSENPDIFFCLSLPLKPSPKSLPCVIVLAGVETGQKNIDYISDPNNYILVGYEYPPILKTLNEKITFSDLLPLRKQTINIPQDILTIIKWLLNQKWTEQKDICVAGYSFGAMLVPAIYHEAQRTDLQLGPGIIAYAGADLYPIFYVNLPGTEWQKFIKAHIASWLFKPLQPSLHLPYLKGNFLIINGMRDKNIPLEQAKKIQELTPTPKTIINLDEPHMSPTNETLIQKVIDISKKWLDKNLKSSS